MSLFPSAFETGSSGSRGSAIAVPGAGKRKRASLGKSDDQLRATQANLAKLIDKVERGEVREKSRTEGIGHASKKKKGEKGQAQAQSQPQQREVKHKGGDKPKGKFDKAGGTSTPNKAGKGTPDNRGGTGPKSTPTPSKKGTPKDKSKLGTPGTSHDEQKSQSNESKSSKNKGKGKPPPTQLPAPVVQPTAEESDEPLTDMQRQMRTKLEGARFRWINEQLYSTPSTEAVAMMKKDPKIFADYHAAHRSQTAAWPSPPLPHILELLNPLPKGAVIADLGCGDAGLARALVPRGKVVLSYDLVGDSGVEASDATSRGSEGWVVRADFLTHVPLPGRPGGVSAEEGKKLKKKSDPHASEVVDVVVCCLSLMGTNWVGGIYEAARILKQNGTFHVAEVTSRFVSTEAFVEAVTSFGFVLENQEEPSTHFTLFRFTKKTAVPVGPARGEPGWDERVRAGEEILRACVYKKR